MTKRRGNREGSIYQRADGRWEARVSLPSGRRRAFYGKTRQAVVRRLQEAQKALLEGRPLTGERLTLTAFLARWLEDTAKPSLRPRTFDSYAMIVRQHLAPALGAVRLARLTPDMVQRYMNEKRESGLSATTVKYHHAILRRALTVAERRSLVPRNVAKLVTPLKVEQQEIHPPTVEQARWFMAVLEGERLRALYLVALSLGLRQGEILGLRWGDVNLEEGTLTVRHSLQRYGAAYHLDEPKTRKSRRTLPLPGFLVAELRAHMVRQLQERLLAGSAWTGDAWGLVFTTEFGDPFGGTAVTRRFQRLLEKAELPRWRFHDLRHAAATFMLAKGVGLRPAWRSWGTALSPSRPTPTATWPWRSSGRPRSGWRRPCFRGREGQTVVKTVVNL